MYANKFCGSCPESRLDTYSANTKGTYVDHHVTIEFYNYYTAKSKYIDLKNSNTHSYSEGE